MSFRKAAISHGYLYTYTGLAGARKTHGERLLAGERPDINEH